MEQRPLSITNHSQLDLRKRQEHLQQISTLRHSVFTFRLYGLAQFYGADAGIGDSATQRFIASTTKG